LIFHSFVIESTHTVVLEEIVDKQKQTAFKNKLIVTSVELPVIEYYAALSFDISEL